MTMRFKFTIQDWQTQAVESVVDVFKGQLFTSKFTFSKEAGKLLERTDYVNEKVNLTQEELLENIREVQGRNNVALSESLTRGLGACSLDIEMETGTGKTYVYIKTMFELNRRYGWSKFIVVVPSIAIREGVMKSFDVMESHFMEHYGKKARCFVYDSKNLSEIDDYSQSPELNVMVINIQAFNARTDIRRIKTEVDAFGSRRPIDVLKANRPILILDEPQKMGGEATQSGLRDFEPLFCLNYSATHRQHHDLVYVLDALDAYNARLVKRIEVKGIDIKNLRGTDGYIFLEEIVLSPSKPPIARVEFEVRRVSGIKREFRLLSVDDDMFMLSHEMEQYRDFRVSDIDPLSGSITFTNGLVIHTGEVIGDVSESDIRRIQIRETIRSHFEKERELHERGIKCLSLFFIDEVSKYRRYDSEGNETNSEYGDIFEREYESILEENLTLYDSPYERYLKNISASQTHAGYFSIDKKGRKINSTTKRGHEGSDDSSAYELILRDKERLLSLSNPVRFIFSHSALREGWDNPNVFQICTLKHGGSSSAQKRQEIGRGLRLCVDDSGVRMDESVLGADVQHVNKLTVIASEGYAVFVESLQRGIAEDVYARPGSESRLELDIADGNAAKIRENRLNANFYREEFQRLWSLINHKYAYTVEFESEELIRKAIAHINDKLYVSRLQYTVTTGGQAGNGDFTTERTRTMTVHDSGGGSVSYDAAGKIAQGTGLTRRTAARILEGLDASRFAMFRHNPEEFISKVTRLINEQKASLTIEHIIYNRTEGVYESSIFTAEKNGDISRAYRAKKNVQDYVLADGYARDGESVERRFARDLDLAEEVCVYAKLPRGFAIPTPAGNYSPDWAITFMEGMTKHIFFIAETKGSMESLQLKPIEQAKIECARRLFRELSRHDVVYHEVDSYETLLGIMES